MQSAVPQGEPEPSEENALAAMQMDKTSARMLLNTSLPVPSDVLATHQKALVQIGQRARQLRRQVRTRLPMCHWPSWKHTRHA